MTLARGHKKGLSPRGRESWPVSTLVRHAISTKNEDTSWKCIRVLHRRGAREVLDAAAALCKSKKIGERRIGADILGQIGSFPEGRSFPDEVLKILYGMLRTETNADILNSVLVAIGHTQESEDMRGVGLVAGFRQHRSPDVRFGVVFALSGREDRRSLGALIKLTEDSDCEVRDWATFGIGTQSDVDTPQIRKALWKRVNDDDLETRCEAIVGLAKRKDPGIRDVLVKKLDQENPDSLIFEATAYYGDPRLLVNLKRHLRTARFQRGVDALWLGALKRAIKDLRQKSH